MFFAGYTNPELMMRAHNRNAVFVTTCEASNILKPNNWAVVTRIGDQEPRCFPDAQIMRPHVVRVGERSGKDGGSPIPVGIAYCALTGTGIVYETPNLPDGTERESVPFTQLENNLILRDRATGHMGHQINGIYETELLRRMGGDSYQQV
jgi:hypothetical protein